MSIEIKRTNYQDFYKEFGNSPDFIDSLEEFHDVLVKCEGMGLMVPVDNYGEWYSVELLKEAEERLPEITEVAYVMKDDKLSGFAIWKVGIHHPNRLAIITQ